MKRDLPAHELPDIDFWTLRMRRARRECIAMATLFTLNGSHTEAGYWMQRLAMLDAKVFRNAEFVGEHRPYFLSACGYSSDDLALLGTT